VQVSAKILPDGAAERKLFLAASYKLRKIKKNESA
jgi:hypothetical protein